MTKRLGFGGFFVEALACLGLALGCGGKTGSGGSGGAGGWGRRWGHGPPLRRAASKRSRRTICSRLYVDRIEERALA